MHDEASECPDLAVVLFHVACMLVYDPVESAVFDRFHDVIIIRDIDDAWLVVYSALGESGACHVEPDLQPGYSMLAARDPAEFERVGLRLPRPEFKN